MSNFFSVEKLTVTPDSVQVNYVGTYPDEEANPHGEHRVVRRWSIEYPWATSTDPELWESLSELTELLKHRGVQTAQKFAELNGAPGHTHMSPVGGPIEEGDK